MDPRLSSDTDPTATHESAHAVLTEVTCTWSGAAFEPTRAVVLHSGSGMLVLEAADAEVALPPIGTPVAVTGESLVSGKLAEHGRGGRFLVSVGDRPVRRSLRLRVSLPAVLRGSTVPQPQAVELADLTTGGARVRGVELPVHSQVTLDFTPPGRDEPVSVRASVAHSTHGARQPWIGVAFRLVALRGGR